MKTKAYKPNKNTSGSVKEPMVSYGTTAVQQYVTQGDYALVKKARQGMDTTLFYTLSQSLNIPEKTLAAVINLSPRTISNYREQQKTLDPNYSEHLLKIANLYSLGQEIFGTLNEFNQWMERPFYNSKECPKDFLNTYAGVELIIQEIEKLAQGYPV